MRIIHCEIIREENNSELDSFREQTKERERSIHKMYLRAKNKHIEDGKSSRLGVGFSLLNFNCRVREIQGPTYSSVRRARKRKKCIVFNFIVVIMMMMMMMMILVQSCR